MTVTEEQLMLRHTLSSLMKEKSLTFRELAKESGIGPSTIFSWANGTAPRDLVALAKIAKLLGVSLHYLLFGVEENGSNRFKK